MAEKQVLIEARNPESVRHFYELPVRLMDAARGLSGRDEATDAVTALVGADDPQLSSRTSLAALLRGDLREVLQALAEDGSLALDIADFLDPAGKQPKRSEGHNP